MKLNYIVFAALVVTFVTLLAVILAPSGSLNRAVIDSIKSKAAGKP